MIEPLDGSNERKLVTATTNDGVGLIRLSDSRHRNALSFELSNQLAESVAMLLDDGVGAIVLLAEPPVFCAGGSLDGLARRDIPIDDTYRGYLSVAESPVPTIAAVGGAAIGAGVNLALACDVILTSPRALFDPRFLDIGIHPGGGHLWQLQRRIGNQGAAALVLFGDTLDGIDAAKIGLAWRCVDHDALERRAVALARKAASRSHELVMRTKESMNKTEFVDDANMAFSMEIDAQRWSMGQPDFDERVRAARDRVSKRTR